MEPRGPATGIFRAFLEALEGFLRTWDTKDRLRQNTTDGLPKLHGTINHPISSTFGESVDDEEERWRREAVAFCRSQLGEKYVLGIEVEPGEEDLADTWDCSELSQLMSHKAGWSPVLPDGAWQQYEVCRSITSPKAGDLGFLWSDKRGMIGHVMVYTGEGTFIHAVKGRGVVEDPVSMWENHPRWRGARRAPCFRRQD